MFKVILDTMGSDEGMSEVVQGALLALDKSDKFKIVFVGPKDEIKKVIEESNSNFSNRIEIIDCSEEITNHDPPTSIIREKKNCSMAIAFNLLKDSENAVFVSAGSTGAVLVGGTLIVGRSEGLDRLALATFLPTANGKQVLFLDCGANVDCKPEYLLQFATVASEFLKDTQNIENPKVGLLNIGTEECKGNALAKSAYILLKNSKLNFGGNVEARDVLTGNFDAIVCDGFWGNIFIKTLEGVGQFIKSQLHTGENKNSNLENLGKINKFVEYDKAGGALLLGAKKLIFKTHGSSNRLAICETILQAYRAGINRFSNK